MQQQAQSSVRTGAESIDLGPMWNLNGVKYDIYNAVITHVDLCYPSSGEGMIQLSLRGENKRLYSLILNFPSLTHAALSGLINVADLGQSCDWEKLFPRLKNRIVRIAWNRDKKEVFYIGNVIEGRWFDCSTGGQYLESSHNGLGTGGNTNGSTNCLITRQPEVVLSKEGPVITLQMVQDGLQRTAEFPVTAQSVTNLLKTFGVTRLSKLAGRYVRFRSQKCDLGDLMEDRWIKPSEFRHTSDLD